MKIDIDDAAKRIAARIMRYIRRRRQIDLSYYVCMGFSVN